MSPTIRNSRRKKKVAAKPLKERQVSSPFHVTRDLRQGEILNHSNPIRPENFRAACRRIGGWMDGIHVSHVDLKSIST